MALADLRVSRRRPLDITASSNLNRLVGTSLVCGVLWLVVLLTVSS